MSDTTHLDTNVRGVFNGVMKGAFTLDHLEKAQNNFRAQLVPGCEALTEFIKTDTLRFSLLPNDQEEVLVAYARSAYMTTVKNLTAGEWCMLGVEDCVERAKFIKDLKLTEESPVTYVLLDPALHEVRAMDDFGESYPKITNYGFVLQLH